MKYLKVLFLTLFVGLLAMAATAPRDKFAYGKRQAVTLSIESDSLVVVSPNNLTLTYATLAADTSFTVDVNVKNSIVGDRLILHVTADATNRAITWGENITAVNDSVLAGKTKLFEFIYNGSGFFQIAEMQVD